MEELKMLNTFVKYSQELNQNPLVCLFFRKYYNQTETTVNLPFSRRHNFHLSVFVPFAVDRMYLSK